VLSVDIPEKDGPGPEHHPLEENTTIEGLQLWRFPRVNYQGGTLIEVHRTGWKDMFGAEGIPHLYWISSELGQSRAWGVHEHTTDRYVCVVGSVQVACFDNRAESPSKGNLEIIVLSPGEGLLIPPGVFHTFRPSETMSVLMNSKSPAYNAKDVDKKKLPMPNSLIPFEWSV